MCRYFNTFLEMWFGGGGGGGGIALSGEKNVKNIQKTNKLCYCLGGNFKT